MIRCENCGGEIEEGRASCPHCGRPAAAGSQVVTAPEPPRAVPMSSFGERTEEDKKSRRVIYVAVAVAAALLVAGLAYLARRSPSRQGEEPRLAGAVRPGSSEFPAADKLIVEFDPNENAKIGPTALGPWAVTMEPVVRNFTGRTVSGLEFRISGVDLKGQVIRERTVVNTDEIEPNTVLVPPLGINFPQENRPADLKLQLTGVRFK